MLLRNTLALEHTLTKQIRGNIGEYASLEHTLTKQISRVIAKYDSLRTYPHLT